MREAMRPYTDEEMGYIGATLDQPSKQVAKELGRKQHQVLNARVRFRRGWQGKQHWTAVEDALIRASQHRTAAQIAELLPGRSSSAVANRRKAIQACTSKAEKSAWAPGNRPLIAKTCRKCGLLLPAEWFTFSKGVRIQSCRKCRSDKRRSEYEPAPGSSAGRDDRRRESAYVQRAQQITALVAEKSGEPYTEDDHKVLSDPTMTRLAKALALKRTYAAVSRQVHVSGYPSFTGVSDPEKDQWLIDNPNADRVDEITASLNERELVSAGNVRPDFDWDD